MSGSRWRDSPIYVEPYKYKIHIIVGEREWREFCKESGVEKDVKGIDGLVWPLEEAESGATFCAFYIDKQRANAGIVLHECVHIVHEALEDRGVPISHENTEVMAYHIEHLFNEIVEELKERKVNLKLT